MKFLVYALVGLFVATASNAGGLLIRSNVSDCGGDSMAGFTLTTERPMYFVAESAAASTSFCKAVTIVPDGVDVYNLEEVTDWLTARGITDYSVHMMGGNECKLAMIRRTDPDANGRCYADDGVVGTIGARGSRTAASW